MKTLVLFDYPPSPGGLATQGDLLYKGLQHHGVDVFPVHFESAQEKEWYYRWFKPDVVVGIGYWGHTPYLVMHPQKFGVQAVPWLVADGFVANYRDVLDSLPLILTTSEWVKQVYIRDGIRGDDIRVLPVGCDTENFIPRDRNDPKVKFIREALGVAPDELMILTVGGDAASKGGQEIMQALAMINNQVPKWKYVCKVWPQLRTEVQNKLDMDLATQLGIEKNIIYAVNKVSRNFMPYLLAACDIYAAPSRLEGFGMPQVEAGACGKPVLSINAMAPAETLVHGETAMLAGVGQEIRIGEAILGEESGYPKGHRIVFENLRIVDYRASVPDIADHLKVLMNDAALRDRMGAKGRERVVANYDYRVVAQRFIDLAREKLGDPVKRSTASSEQTQVAKAKSAALEVLLNNARGPCENLPRAAAWGYPEPYTRDMMISSLGFLVSGNAGLRGAVRRVLATLGRTQTPRGHITSLAHDPKDLGSSDSTPLFLFGLGLYRRASGNKRFLEKAAAKALRWMEYQSPDDMIMVAQLPTTDWRDEQWVLGYGLYVNTIVYASLRLHGRHREADLLRVFINLPDIRGARQRRHFHEGFAIPGKPYYALWSFKIYNSERFDLLGNSLAILTGVASPTRARQIIDWTEKRCRELRESKDLKVNLPPCLMPYIRPSDSDWLPRYNRYNRPGDYHNGGIWPFICGFYIAALVAAGRKSLAAEKLAALAELVRPTRKVKVAFGFNEWIKAQTGRPMGQDWQTWSAAMYLYAADCVEQGRTPFFDEIRTSPKR